MNIEKLNPWNWFKHEEDSNNQIPVSKNEAFSEVRSDSNVFISPEQSPLSSLLQLHQELDGLLENVWQSLGVPDSSRLSHIRSLFGNNLQRNKVLNANRAKLDVSGNEEEYEISVELPGLSESDIQIELSANTLVVKGQMQEDRESKGKQYYCVERSMGAFQRTLSLPEDVDKEAISATLKNGLLIIQLPRKTTASDNIKRISISS